MVRKAGRIKGIERLRAFFCLSFKTKPFEQSKIGQAPIQSELEKQDGSRTLSVSQPFYVENTFQLT